MIVFPGTFDPITLGHVRLIERAVAIFDHVIVAVAQKAPDGMFTFDQRLTLANTVWENNTSVEVKPMNGLMIDFMAQEGINLVLRGLRNGADFTYEQHLEAANARLSKQLEWCYLATEPEMLGVSSSIVRQIIREAGVCDAFVPQSAIKLMSQWCK